MNLQARIVHEKGKQRLATLSEKINVPTYMTIFVVWRISAKLALI
jgi:hypothetical protein